MEAPPTPLQKLLSKSTSTESPAQSMRGSHLGIATFLHSPLQQQEPS